jgi:hypothetical protein
MSANFRKLYCLALFLYLASVCSTSTLGQDRRPPKDPPERKEGLPVPGPEPPGFFNGDGFTSERSMQVDGSVAIKLCVEKGNLKVNGWRRNEVRVFVKNGRRFAMKTLEKSPETGKVNWLRLAHAPVPGTRAVSECLTGDSVEIDAPIGSSFDIGGRAGRMSIDSVKNVKIKILEGIIMLRNVAGGIEAYTGRGDLLVDNSAGAIWLENTTGNIVAIDVKPGKIGEVMRAKTNGGAITMQRVEHRQIEASSISGSLLFDGKFLSGGIYNFRTSKGSIKLSLPAATSCTFKAIYGAGEFESEIPLKIITQNNSPRLKTVVATMGSGDAAVNLTTSTGSIGIRKTAVAPRP